MAEGTAEGEVEVGCFLGVGLGWDGDRVRGGGVWRGIRDGGGRRVRCVAGGVRAGGGQQCGVQLGEGDEVACSGGVDGAEDGGVVVEEGAEEG